MANATACFYAVEVDAVNTYRQTRNYENLQKAYFWGAGPYDIPALSPVKTCDVENWIGFNYAKGCDDPDRHGVHFFVDDYQFERVWKQPDVYTPMLAKFRAVCTPDFSPYADFPKAIQLYNHYRKHWCGAYWQAKGLTVIPTITWSSPDTLEWCFDGEPVGGVVAMSSVGMVTAQEYRSWLLTGYEAMLERLEPVKIVWKGHVPEELRADVDSGLIYQIPSFTDKWHRQEAGNHE